MSKNQNSESPFGDYGIVIKCLTFKNINVRKIDMLKITNAEYLIDHRYAFNIVKWDQQELIYRPLIKFNGNNFVNIKDNKLINDEIQPAHIWIKDEELFQNWLGEYYSDAITTTLVDSTDNFDDYYEKILPNKPFYPLSDLQWNSTDTTQIQQDTNVIYSVAMKK